MRAAAAAALLLLAMPFADARADVLEIGRAGSTVVRASDSSWSGEPAGDAAATDGSIDALGLPNAAVTTLAAPALPATVNAAFTRAATAANVNPSLLEALVWQESRWRSGAISPKGAVGLTQLMPGTARDLLVDPHDVSANLAGGARYLRRMLDMFDGDIERALAAYNAGPGRVRLARGIPAIAETRAYVSSIIDRLGVQVAPLVKGAAR